MDWHYSVFWIVLIFKLTCGEYCLRTLETKRDVSSCPKNKQEWEAASKRMDCSEIKKTGNCEDVIYHCLRDAVTNTMVEVCTVPKNLNGYCPYFYHNPPYVRNDYYRDCSNSSMCPTFYSSKDAYNYSACYNDTSIVTTVSASEPTSSTVLNPTSVFTVQTISASGIAKESETSNNTWKWVLPLVIIFLVLIVVHISLVVWVKKRGKRISVREVFCIHLYILKESRKGGKDGKGNEDPQKADEEESLLPEGNIGNKNYECAEMKINEGGMYEKEVSPESDGKNLLEVDLENKPCMKNLTQKDESAEGGTTDYKGLDTSNNANETADKTTDAKEAMKSDSTEDKRDPIEGGIKTTSAVPQKETPPPEGKVPIAGGSVDEGNKDNECDKRKVIEGGTNKKDVSPESDAKEPMESDSIENKRDTVEGGIKITSAVPQKETPPTEGKVPNAGGSVDEDKQNNPNPGSVCRRKDVREENGIKKEATNFQREIRDLQSKVDGLLHVMTKLCGKGKIYYAEKNISDMEIEMTLIENKSSNPRAKLKKLREEFEELKTRIDPVEEIIDELDYDVEEDGMPIQVSDDHDALGQKPQQAYMNKSDEKKPEGKDGCSLGVAEMKNPLPASNQESYNMYGILKEGISFIEEDKQEDKQGSYQTEHTDEDMRKIIHEQMKKKDPTKVKWNGNSPGSLRNECCGDDTESDKNPDPKQQKNPGRLENLESKIKELQEEIQQLGEDIHSVTGVGTLHNTEKKIKQLTQDVTLLEWMVNENNMYELEDRIKNCEEKVKKLQKRIDAYRENRKKIFDSVDFQKNCESDSL